MSSEPLPPPSPAAAAAPDLDAHESFPASSPAPNVASLCPRLKFVYERCFQHWYTHHFLQRNSHELPCEDEYRQYQACVLTRLDPAVAREIPPIDEANPGNFPPIKQQSK